MLPNRLPALILGGLFAWTAGGVFLAISRFRLKSGAGLLAAGLSVLGLVFLINAAVVFTHRNETFVDAITISDAYVLPTASAQDVMPGMLMGNPTTTAYMTIQNSSSQADHLIAVSCDSAQVAQFHQTTVANDIASMQTETNLTIPANGMLTLKPGSTHIMLSSLTRDLVTGDNVVLLLTFQSGTRIQLRVAVRSDPPPP